MTEQALPESVQIRLMDMEYSNVTTEEKMGNFTRDTNVFHRVMKIDVHEDVPDIPEDFTVLLKSLKS